MPVKEVTTALPPKRSWLLTRTFVRRAKKMKTQWVRTP